MDGWPNTKRQKVSCKCTYAIESNKTKEVVDSHDRPHPKGRYLKTDLFYSL